MNIKPIVVEMNAEELATVMKLMERDEPMAVKDATFTYNGETHECYHCPVCEEYLTKEYNFCPTCGQRVDHETIAL